MLSQNVPADNLRPPSNPLLAAALQAAGWGWKVFPCHDVANGACSCGDQHCKRPGKHPRLKGWAFFATSDPIKLHVWWNKWPAANLAIRTGQASGVWVIDVDDDEAHVALCTWELTKGPLPRTLVARTPRGGWHYYFHCPQGTVILNRVRVGGVNIDVRGERGYVLIPPSRGLRGAYRWEGSVPC